MTLPMAMPSRAPVFDLSGRTALITGGSRGNGRAMASRFLEAGATVIITARRADVLEETRSELDRIAPGRCAAVACDVADPGQIKTMWDKLAGDGHAVDILVNNAGTSARGAFEGVSDETWQADLDQKLFAAIRLCRLVIPGMKARKWGRILNVSSIHGKAPGPNSCPTTVSRAAGLALTKALSQEFAPHNILVNALCTGLIATDQAETRWKQSGTELSFEDYLKDVEGKRVPIGRVGTAEEYANVALFLVSDLASYITGSAINIDGGECKVL